MLIIFVVIARLPEQEYYPLLLHGLYSTRDSNYGPDAFHITLTLRCGYISIEMLCRDVVELVVQNEIPNAV